MGWSLKNESYPELEQWSDLELLEALVPHLPAESCRAPIHEIKRRVALWDAVGR